MPPDPASHPLWRPLDDGANAARQSLRVAHRQTPPGPLRGHDPAWAADFQRIRARIEAALADRALEIRHVGSTAVPGLLAKPVIDVDLIVADVEDEAAWLAPLEAAGLLLLFRDEIAGDPHRQLSSAEPNANVHVFSPGAREPRRHALLVAWLLAHDDDRERYAAAKRSAADAAAAGERYNDGKARVVHEIVDRMLAADLERP